MQDRIVRIGRAQMLAAGEAVRLRQVQLDLLLNPREKAFSDRF